MVDRRHYGGVGSRRLPKLLAVLAAVVAGAILGMTVMLVVGGVHAFGVLTAAEDAEAAVGEGDLSAAADSLADLQQHSAGVARWLGGQPWRSLTWLPVVGDAVAAGGEMARGLDAVVDPLAAATGEVLAVAEGSPQEAIAVLNDQRELFVAAGRAAQEYRSTIAGIDAEALGPLADPVREAQSQFALLSDLATGAAAGAVLLPGLLGLDEPTDWLLVASQPAEARGSGAGFFGAVAVMQGSGGAAGLTAVHPNDDFYDVPADLTRLPTEFSDLWGESAAYVWGHNLTRHFPYAAELLRESSSAVTAPTQYVVAADPSVVAALLSLTGPVTAAGVTIDANSAERYLTQDIYADFPVGGAKDQAASQLLAAAFNAFLTADFSPTDVAYALAGPIAQQRLVAWAAEPEEQEVLSWSPVAGAVPTQPWQLTAAINNAAGNKLDAYLATEVVLAPIGDCTAITGGEIALEVELGDVPPGLPNYVVEGVRGPEEYGGTRLLLHVYGPPGAELASATVDGEPVVAALGEELGRPVWAATVDLVPNQRRSFEVSFTGSWQPQPFGFRAQPMVQDTAVRLVDTQLCAGGS